MGGEFGIREEVGETSFKWERDRVNQEHLLTELQNVGRSVERLLGLMPVDRLDWRPRENMRTLLELANHLAQIPAVDLAILQASSQETVRGLEARLSRAEPAEIAVVWRGGVEAVEAFFRPLTAEQFENQVGKAFYGHEATLAEWLLEIVTHTYHHRAQLFTYLKLMGLPVDMFTLYA